MPKAPLFVVPIDFSPDMEATVSAAFALARKCGAKVHLLEVVGPRRASRLEDNADVRLAGRGTATRERSRLDRLLRAGDRASIQTRTVTHRGEAPDIIPAYTQLVKATLLVIGQHYGTPRWRRSTRIVSTLSRAAPAPVLVLPARPWSQKGSVLSFGHIVSAIDFTVASAVAMRTVLDVIRRTGARLTLVHALKDAPHHMVFSGGEALRVTRDLRAKAAQVAALFRKRIPSTVSVRVDARVTTGDPHRGILDIASEVDADLIVLGAPPRSRFDEVLFGSTRRNVLRRSQIPVLILPVPAGAHRWLQETDAVEVAATPKETRALFDRGRTR